MRRYLVSYAHQEKSGANSFGFSSRTVDIKDGEFKATDVKEFIRRVSIEMKCEVIVIIAICEISSVGPA